MPGEASREELNALGDSLREAIGSDRAERVEHLTRIETKFDTRMDAFYSILADYREKTGDQAARLQVLERGIQAHLEDSDRRFESVQREVGRRIEDLVTGNDKRLLDMRATYDSRLTVIERKQERNWGWVMGVFAALIVILLQSGWNFLTRSAAGHAPASKAASE